MSCIKDDCCWSSADYLEKYTGYRPCDDISLVEFEKVLEENEVCLWNYPLTEIEYLLENNINVILVRFPDMNGEYEYRFCEIPTEDEKKENNI